MTVPVFRAAACTAIDQLCAETRAAHEHHLIDGLRATEIVALANVLRTMVGNTAAQGNEDPTLVVGR